MVADPSRRDRQAMNVTRHFSGAPWEIHVGYCRAIRAGDHICVTGCAPLKALIDPAMLIEIEADAVCGRLPAQEAPV